jgi:hypothetical protein
MHGHSPLTLITAAIGGFFASSSVAPVPDLAFVTQFAGIGALFGTLAVLRSDANRRRRRLPVDVNRRWSIVARCTMLGAAVGILVDVVVRVLGAA